MSITTKELGDIGEREACTYLESIGMIMIDANWSCPMGEIDLIMRDGSTLVFVEVRMRSSVQYGEGLDTIGRDKQNRVIRTAEGYQQKHNYWGDIRFDVVSIVSRADDTYEITHVPHAFMT